MANNKKVITLGLDYSQFDGGITEVNRKMGLLDAEFKLATEKTKAFGTETDQLTLKQEALTQKIILQTKKVELSKEAYDKAMSSGKASERQIDNLDKALLRERTTLEKLNNELNNNKEKIEAANKSSESFGDQIRGLASALGIDVNPAVEALATKFDGLDKNVGNAILTIGTVITTLGALTFSTAEAAGEIDELAHKTGLTTDTIQELNYAAEYLEISADEIGSSITKLTRNMDSARKGSGDAADAFRKLGVRIKDSRGNLLDSEQVFYNTIDALGKVRNETDRDALSMSIFGKSAMSLNNLILEGSAGIKEYARQAHEAGYVMDTETIDSFNKMDDSMVALNKKFEAVKMSLGQGLLPVITVFADLLAGIPTPVLVGITVFGILAAIFISVTKAVSGLALANAALSASNVAVGTTGGIATAGMLPLLATLLAIAAVIAVVVGGASAIGGAMKSATTETNKMIEEANKSASAMQNAAQRSNQRRGYATGTKDYPGGSAWVGEDGPEIVTLPKGSKIYTNAESKALTSGGDTYNMYVNARDIKEFNDMVRIFEAYKQTVRQGRVKNG